MLSCRYEEWRSQATGGVSGFDIDIYLGSLYTLELNRFLLAARRDSCDLCLKNI